MAKYLLLGFLLFGGITFPSQAQTADSVLVLTGKHRYLLLSSTSSVDRFRFHEGEEITFRLKEGKTWYSGTVLQLRPQSFLFSNTEIPLNKIAQLKLKNPTVRHKIANITGVLLQSAGGLFTLVGAVNVVTNLSDKPDRNEGFITMGAAVTSYAVGLGLKKLRYGNYRLGEKWKLKVIEMY